MAFVPGFSTSATRGRLYVIREQSLCVAPGARVPVDAAPDDAIYLGELDGEPCFACAGDGDAMPGTDLVALRQLFGALPDEDFGIAARALGLLAWDRDHRFCGRCAAPTARSTTERVRTCGACGHGAYPRLSPAVIVLVERDGRALLARNARFPLPFFSTLAGFVEVGETLEDAVAREIHEEAGITVGDIRYFGSQPWPFTGSLMIGFTARWTGGDLTPDGTEIVDADWFAPDALPRLPPPLSIARALIDDFVARSTMPHE
ncbi:MAG TPA: NAD(+) diphosphatase [Kofleriaceae bacterium]|nr:NAD(+) diphosphatase [Kofleriaceae bacterium]